MSERIEISDISITLTDNAIRRITENTFANYTPREVCRLLRNMMLSRLGVGSGWYTKDNRTKWVEMDGYGHYESEEYRGKVTPEQFEVLECLDTVYDLLCKGKGDAHARSKDD